MCFLVESTEPKQVYSVKLGFVSERTIKDIIIINPRENVPNGYILVGWLLFLQAQIKVIIIKGEGSGCVFITTVPIIKDVRVG